MSDGRERTACLRLLLVFTGTLTIGCVSKPKHSALDAGVKRDAGATAVGGSGHAGSHADAELDSGSVGEPNGGSSAAADGGRASADAGIAGDTYLPWAGGPSYFAKWSHGPASDATYFPIGVWLQTPSNAKRYAAVGINLFVGLYEGPTDAQLSTLKAASMPTVCDQSGVWSSHTSDTTLRGWLQPDEPDNAQPKADGGDGYDPCIPPSTIVTGYQKMRANDATRPVWLGLGRGVSDTAWVGRGTCTSKTEMYPDYAKGADILSFDIYPVNSGLGLEAVPNGVDNLLEWSGHQKPVIADIEASNIDNTTRPTPEQIESEVWMALVHGASGVQYFCHRFSPTFSETDCLDDTKTGAALTRIDAQLTQLAPVLNSRSVANGVTVSSSRADKLISVMLKRYAGASYLFAVAMRVGATKGTFKLLRLPAKASAEVIGEGRTIEVVNGAFADEFSSYAVHRYKLTY